MFAYLIHPETQLVVARFEGRIDAAEFRQFFDCLDGDPAYLRTMNGLVDIRWVEAALGMEEIQGLADYAVAKQLKRGRWAVLVDLPKPTALSMLYTKAVDSRYDFQVFSTVPGVSEYLGIDVSGYLQPTTTREA